MGNLTALQLKSLTKPGRYSDGDGLMLQVGPQCSQSWVLRVQINGKRRDIGLGNAKAISLREAREKASELRKLARSGVDPLEEKRRARIVIPTFREATTLAHAEISKGWKNGKHHSQWLSTMEKYAWPKLGDLRVDKIEGPAICDALAEIWLEIPETARRVKQRIGAILDWSYVKGYRDSEAPMRSITRGLARQPRNDGHFKALSHEEIPDFFVKLRERQFSSSRLALQFLILTATRSGEVRGACWNEFDSERNFWTIPAGRMKAGKPHIVPLSAEAKEVLSQAECLRYPQCNLVFPGSGRRLAVSTDRTINKQMSDMALLQLLRGMEAQITVHGFRSTFRDWVADKTDFPREVAEAALAHTLENKVEAAYRRTDYLAKRGALMSEWATYCWSKLG